jgi:hypothetical protein
MPTARRQMHLGVFVLGTGNHMAGWRHDGAVTTHMELRGRSVTIVSIRGLFEAHLNVSNLEHLIGFSRAQLGAAMALEDAFNTLGTRRRRRGAPLAGVGLWEARISKSGFA